jgi:hypothetical protein
MDILTPIVCEAFLHQREAFHATFQHQPCTHGHSVRGTWPGLAATLVFAEELILAPDDLAVRIRIERDPKGAWGFLTIADQISDVVACKFGISISDKDAKEGSPFYVLCSLVKDWLEMHQREWPDRWN